MKFNRSSFLTFIALMVAVTFVTCGKTGQKSVITHIPVQIKNKGNWSLWDIKTGAILYEGEFKKEPTVVSEGVFITRNDEGELFYNKIEDDKNFEQIAGPYLRGSLFSEGIAIVCKEESYPSAINTSGEEVFNLEPQDGVTFQSVGQCIDGLIKFQADNGLWGFLDKKGKIAIKPRFDYVDDFREGKARATLHAENKDEFVIIDSDGEVVTEVDQAYIGNIIGEKMVYSDSKKEFGILAVNKEKEKLLNASDKFERLNIDGEDIFYKADDGWGMIDKEGEITIRAKYVTLSRLSDDVYLGFKKDGDDALYELLNKKGEVIKKEEVDGAVNLRNGNFLVKDGKEYQIVDEEGKAVGTNTVKDVGGVNDIVRVASNYSDMVESDYFDWGKIKEYVGTIKSGSLAGFSLGVNCIQAASQLEKLGSVASNASAGKDDQGKGLVFQTLSFGWVDNNGTEVIFIGTGYEDKETGSAGQEGATPDTYDSPAAVDTAKYVSKETPIPDNAPGWALYQSYLNISISMGRSGTLSVWLNFDDYIKKPKTMQVPVDYDGYSTYIEEKTVSYEKNPDAKVSVVSVQFELQTDKREKLQKLIDEAFSKGFTSAGSRNGVSLYTDASGNRWEINGTEIKLLAPATTEYSKSY